MKITCSQSLTPRSFNSFFSSLFRALIHNPIVPLFPLLHAIYVLKLIRLVSKPTSVIKPFTCLHLFRVSFVLGIFLLLILVLLLLVYSLHLYTCLNGRVMELNLSRGR